MRIEFCRNLNRNYMVVRDVKTDTSSFDVQMAVRAKSICLMPVEYIMSNGEIEYWYDITGKQPFQSTVEVRKIGYQQLKDFVDQLVGVCQEVEGYLLDENALSLNSEIMFYDLNTKRFVFCYVPGYEASNQEELEELAQLMLQRIDHGDKQAVSVGYQLYEKIVGGCFGIAELSEFFQKKQEFQDMDFYREKPRTVEQQSMDWEEEDEDDYLAFWEQREATVFDRLKGKISLGKSRGQEKEHAKKSGKKKAVFSYQNSQPEQTVIAERIGALQWCKKNGVADRNDMETVYLGNIPKPEFRRLEYRGQNGRPDLVLAMDKDDYFIGSNKDAVDGYIDGEGISRIHARIFKREDQYYVEDLNSTNGTTLNEESIVYHDKRKLNIHDRLMFAEEMYEFL